MTATPNMYRVVLLLETGMLRTVYVPGATAHEARRTIAGWVGRQHTDAVALVHMEGMPRTPRRRAPSRTAHASLLLAMVAAAMLLLLLLFILTT